jgi:hypothetical protein
MFKVFDFSTQANGDTDGSPYANELAKLNLPLTGITNEYVDLTPDNLSVSTDTPAFIQTGSGNDVISDLSNNPGDVVIDAGTGINSILANGMNRETILLDTTTASAGTPLIDVISGLTNPGDRLIFEGLNNPTSLVAVDSRVGTHTGLLLANGNSEAFLDGFTSKDVGGRVQLASDGANVTATIFGIV